MQNEKLEKLGDIIAIIVLIVSALIIWGLVGEINMVFWFFIIALFVFGPACFVLYLGEVKKGVFRDEDKNK